MNKFIAYLRTKSFYKNLGVVFLAVVAFLLCISYSLTIYTRHGEGLLVPKLEGLPIEKAIEALDSRGLRYQIDSVYVAEKMPGLVIAQDPDPATHVKTHRNIYLTMVTQLAPSGMFPDISDKTFLEAQAILVGYGFKVGDTTYASGIERNMVLESSFAGQLIDKGQLVRKGSRIDLVLGDGKGASQVDLPSLLGLSLNEARMSLLGSSLVLGNVTFESPDADAANAKVIKQEPMPSDSLNKVNIGTPIDVVLAR